MKKKYVYITIVLFLISAFNLYKGKQLPELTFYAFFNLEALANGESGDILIKEECYFNVTSNVDGLFTQKDCNKSATDPANVVSKCKDVRTNLQASTNTGTCFTK